MSNVANTFADLFRRKKIAINMITQSTRQNVLARTSFCPIVAFVFLPFVAAGA